MRPPRKPPRTGGLGGLTVVVESSMQRDVITVDGLGASGKSALAKALAVALGYGHLNSGLLYRAVGYLVLQAGRELSVEHEVLSVLGEHSLALSRGEAGESVVLADGKALLEELSAPTVSDAASLVARHQAVRDALLPLQQHAFEPLGVVAEGRDMGTVVFPNARVKFFVTAPSHIRAERRFAQLKGTPQEDTLENITTALLQRDQRDTTSAVGTTKQAPGAVVIENYGRSIEDTVREMLACARAKQG